jgi:hypothetical protein
MWRITDFTAVMPLPCRSELLQEPSTFLGSNLRHSREILDLSAT